MNHKLGQQPTKRAGVTRLLGAALVIACTLAIVNDAAAQRVTPPTTPTDITPPEESSAFLLGHAFGTQGYVCLPTSTGASTASWTVNNARPEATLFGKFFGREIQIITHFLSPNTSPRDNAPKPLPFGNATWQSSLDSSKVWAQATGSIPAGSDSSSCPNAGSIACLLLEVIGDEEGPTGGKSLTRTSFIQRLNTKGGSAPETGCSVASDVGKQALVPYTADYVFFRKGE